VTPIRIPGSTQHYTEAELRDRFLATDWFPQSHAPMPGVVAHGEKPDVFACGFCHSPRGQGRPENAALAGLPTRYILRQLEDLRSGARRGAGPATYRPTANMVRIATHVRPEDALAAAEYFSRQRLDHRVNVHEQEMVPKVHVAGILYAFDEGRGEEPLAGRLLEVAPDYERHERHEDGLVYEAFVPPGSLARGQELARKGAAPIPACESCHGAGLRGVGEAPPLAGRFPTYLLRQLLAFRTGSRRGPASEPMREVASKLELRDMIAAAAYAASLAPESP